MYEIRHYLTADKKDVYFDWLRKLRDMTARIAIDRRVNRVELGNFGDHKFCRDGVWDCVLMSAQRIGCITLLLAKKWCCFSAAEINELRLKI